MLFAAVVACVFGGAELHAVEEVERLRAQCEIESVPNPRAFGDGKIELLTPCPRKSGSVRGAFPMCRPQSRIRRTGSAATNPALGTLKQLVLNHLFRRSTADPSIFLVAVRIPVFGCNPYPDPIRFGVAVNPSGKPACSVVTPFRVHPLISSPQKPGRPFSEPLAFAERQVDHVVDDDPVPGIEAAQCVFV